MTIIQEIVNHYFYSQGLDLDDIKEQAKTGRIVYARHTRPAKQLLGLCDSVENAKRAIDKVASWAKARGLDYTLWLVVKKWIEIGKL